MLLDRIIRVFKLDASVFDEVENDTEATIQAAIIVAIVAVLSAFGSAFGAIFGDRSIIGSFFSTLAWAFVGWFLWSAVTYFVGTSFFKGQATVDKMLRVIGFSYAPQMLSIIPCFGGIVGWAWSLLAGFVAVRQGLELDDTNACLTIIIGFFLYMIGFAVLGMITGGLFWLF